MGKEKVRKRKKREAKLIEFHSKKGEMKMERKNFKMLPVVFLVSISLFAGSASYVHSGGNAEPPPTGYGLSGPGVLAIMTLDGINVSFKEVSCKGKEQPDPLPQPIIGGYDLNDVKSAQDVVGLWTLGNPFPGCIEGDVGIIIQAAHGLTEGEILGIPYKEVNVVVLFLVPK